jgi:hypothetical protein
MLLLPPPSLAQIISSKILQYMWCYIIEYLSLLDISYHIFRYLNLSYLEE